MDPALTQNSDAPRASGARFKAFLSYSRRDERTAKWIHAQLEAYRTPREVIASGGVFGTVARRIAPIFRDRTDLTSGGNLSTKLVSALEESEFLIVLCSPHSAKSSYVDAEVKSFVDMGRSSHLLPVIVSGEPNSGNPSTECMPPALRSLEMLAADLRDIKLKSGQRIGDGREGGKFKLIAGMLGVPLDSLLQRERKRQSRRAALSALASFVFLGLAFGAAIAAWIAYQNEIEARRQTAAAQASADFLVNTFEVAIPVKESPDSISARTILNRGAERISAEFSNQPEIKIRLIDAIARAYSYLGLIQDSREVLERDIASVRAAGADGVRSLLTLARDYQRDGKLEQALKTADEAERQLNASGKNRPDLRGYLYETRGTIYYDLAKAPEAERNYNLALAEYRKGTTPNPKEIARVLNNRGPSLSDQSKYKEAEQSMLEASRLYAETEGENSMFFGQNQYALAINAYYMQDYAAATKYVERSQAVLTPLLDASHPTLGDLAALRGEIALDNQKLDEARASLQKAIAIYEAGFGKPNVSSGTAFYYLASIDLQQNNFESALAMLDLVKVHFDSTYAADHPNQGDVLVQRAVALRGLGSAAEADASCVRGMAIIANGMGADSDMYKGDLPSCPNVKP